MVVTIYVDNEKNWYVPYAKQLQYKLKNSLKGKVYLAHVKDDVSEGDICFLLSCSHIVKKDFLKRNKHNIVVHASDLPKGKGFTPIKWQVMEGQNDIMLTMFEAVENIDAGPYYMKNQLHLEGYELLDEIHDKMAELINSMCVEFVKNMTCYPPIEQVGEETVFRKFTKDDDMLDINKTIAEQFNHFRIVDNENYPAWFEMDGHRYLLKIFREEQ